MVEQKTFDIERMIFYGLTIYNLLVIILLVLALKIRGVI